MYIKFFKSSFFVQYLLIGIIGVVLWLPAFLHPPQMPPPDGPVLLYSLLYDLLRESPLLATVLGFFLVCGETYFFSLILNKNELTLKNSSLSALVFLVLMSLLPGQLTLTPTTIALLFILLVLHHLLIIYSKPEHFDRVFAAGFFTALASFFYIPVLFWFGFVIVSFLIFRSGAWREWIASTIGLLTPFIYLSVFYLWNDELVLRAREYPDFFRRVLFYPNPFHSDFWITEGVVILLTIWGIVKLWRSSMEKTVELRAKFNLFIWILVFTILSFAFARSLAVYHPALTTPALAMIITYVLTSLKKTRAVEIILLILFILLLINNHVIYPFYFS
ncbi:MAG: hypothetical protein M0Q38_12220 [Bacteroidales bacterium]|nr:hypothetical protein [Bacteroidales bacterium]